MDDFFLLKFAGESSRFDDTCELQMTPKNNRPSRHAGRSGFDVVGLGRRPALRDQPTARSGPSLP